MHRLRGNGKKEPVYEGSEKKRGHHYIKSECFVKENSDEDAAFDDPCRDMRQVPSELLFPLDTRLGLCYK